MGESYFYIDGDEIGDINKYICLFIFNKRTRKTEVTNVVVNIGLAFHFNLFISLS